jgi:hypothetical protein
VRYCLHEPMGFAVHLVRDNSRHVQMGPVEDLIR